MKVLYITPNGVGNISPQIEMANYMKNRFDRLDLVVLGKNNIDNYKHNWDVVFSAMESSVPYGYHISQQLDIPFYAHWEWIPPFRIYGYEGGEDPIKWGFDEQYKKNNYKNKNWFTKYNSIIEAASQATLSSCAGVEFKKTAETFLKRELSNCFIKYPASPLPLNKKRDNEKGDYFITVSRLSSNKRVYELSKAVKKANLDTTWIIVGSGEQEEIIKKELEGGKTKLHFFKNTNGEKKFYLLSKAKFQICAWHGLPQAEAALVGTPTINLDIPYIKEIYGNSLTFTKSIENMAENIKTFYNNGKLCRDKSNYTYESIIDRKININTLESGADIIEQTLKSII
tara:strand:+ start:526 stop:1551 length:1026 start_codon:yes stop_codon:yes gene_type:complete